MSIRTIWKNLAILAIAGLAGTTACGQTATELTGHYSAETQRELASELVLRDDRTFDWMLSYGAIDQFAQGTWTVKAGKVMLAARLPEGAPPLRLFEPEEYRIQKPARAGTWVAIVGKPRTAPIAVPMEVVFESAGGRRFTGVTVPNGDAVAEVPETERWARAGLRRQGSTDALQWFAIPAEQADERIASFAVDDMRWVLPQAFERMQLEVRGKRLLSGRGLTYSKE